MGAIKLSDHPPYLYSEDNIVYANNGDIIKCYTLELQEVYAASENDFDKLFDDWYKAFKNVRPGFIILKQDVYMKEEYDTSSFPDDNFLQKATRKHFSGRSFLKHGSYLFFIYTKTGILKNDHIKNPFKKLPKTIEVNEQRNHIDAAFENDVEQTVLFLNAGRKIKVTPLLKEDIHEYSKSYFNGFYNDRTTDTKRDNRYYQIGNKIIGSYVVNNIRQMPNAISNCIVDDSIGSKDYKFYKGYADPLGLELNIDHVYNQVLFFEDHHLIKKQIEHKREILFGARKFSKDNETGYEQLDTYLKELSGEADIRFVRAHFNVCFFAETEAEFKQADNQVAKTYRQMDIKPYYPIGNHLANIYNNSYFGNWSNLNADNTFVFQLDQALCLFTNVTNYKNDSEGIYFNDRIFNVPVRKDIWDERKKRVKARNFFVVAPTGGGKSVLANHILRYYYEDDVIVVVNDLGDSFQKFAYLFPKDTLYITYKEGESLDINPFYLRLGEELSVTQNNQLVKFIELLWKRDKELESEEEVSLRKILLCYYQNVTKNHSLPSFFEFITLNKRTLLDELEIEYEFFKIEDFLHNCSEFVGEGTYSFLFKQKEGQSYDVTGKRFVVFEFDKAREDPLLLSVLLLMSSEITRRLCWIDKSQKGIIFFDEFAKFLSYPNVLSTVQYYYQAARKQECAIGIVLQSPTQLPINDTASSIIDNTQILYILENDKGYDAVVDRFGMSTHDLNQLMSMRSDFSGKIKFSEFMLLIGKESNVMRLEIAEEVLCAYLTEGREHEKIMSNYAVSENMETAIKKYMNDKNL